MKLLTLTLLAALLMAGCAGGGGAATDGGSIERTDWRLSAPPDGRSLELLVFSGHSSCLTYERVETDETENSVEIRAYVRSNGAESCTDDFVTERVQVRLEQDIANRKLEGCGGPEVDWKGFEEPSNDCRDVYEF